MCCYIEFVGGSAVAIIIPLLFYKAIGINPSVGTFLDFYTRTRGRRTAPHLSSALVNDEEVSLYVHCSALVNLERFPSRMLQDFKT
jgi:hypothetical protein